MAYRMILSSMSVLLGLSLAARGEPYQFRGVSLGTNLADLRRVRFPEVANGKLICTVDEEATDLRLTAEITPSAAEAQAGAIACGVYTFGRVLGAGSNLLPAEWIPASIAISSIMVKATFWFVPGSGPDGDSDENARLYRMAMITNSTFWSATLAAFTRRYGKWTATEKGAFPGPLGIDLDNQIVTWSNAESTIKLTKRAQLPNRMLIEYRHNALAAGVGG